MGWKTIVIGSECSASVTLNRMKIKIGDEYHTIPLCDIDTVIFSHDKVVMTIPLLTALVENNINIIICDRRNDPIGVFQAFNGHSLVFKQLNNQINWKLTRKKKLWKMIIEQKIQTEIDVLKISNKDERTIKKLIEYKNSVYTDDQTNREALSARLYFSSMFGEEFTRNEEGPINHALNYGYKIIASHISRCIASRGFLTQLGIHHIGEGNPFNLTYDFIEPLRAIVDLWVLSKITGEFNTSHKSEIISLLEYKVMLNGKWIRLKDAIEDLVDNYLLFMNEKTEKLLFLDLSKGIRRNDV